MLNKKKAAILVVSILLLLTCCKQLVNELIHGSWEVDEHYSNGVEDTPSFYLLFGDYAITFHPDGDFTFVDRITLVIPIN